MFLQTVKQSNEYSRLQAACSTKGAAALFGLPAPARALLYATLAQETKQPLIVVTSGEAEATRMAQDLNALGVAAGIFPFRDLLLRPIEGTNREIEYRRLQVLGQLSSGQLSCVCLSVESLLLCTMPPAEFSKNTFCVQFGQTIAQANLLEMLLQGGYQRRSQVEGAGQFSVRGGILDIFVPDMNTPVRIEFWGDEIDSIHTFDLITQRREDPLEQIKISPAREVLFSNPQETATLLRNAISHQKGQSAHKLEQILSHDLSLLDSGVMPVAMDRYLM